MFYWFQLRERLVVDKREKMREHARKELAKREMQAKMEKSDQDPSSKNPVAKPEKVPSANSGFIMLFAGSLTLTVFVFMNRPLIGLFASLGFMFIGMRRISRASSRKKQETLVS